MLKTGVFDGFHCFGWESILEDQLSIYDQI